MKKFLVFGLSIGSGAVLAILLALWGVYRYNHPSSPAKDWPSLKESAGINVKLRTELARGHVLYLLGVLPVAADLSPAFDSVANDSGYAKQFTVAFYDAGGFELCSQTITNLTVGVDEKGSVEGLMSTGELSGCQASDYKRARTWDVRYVFPSLSKLMTILNKPSPKAAPKKPKFNPLSIGAVPVNKPSSEAAYAVITDGSNIMSNGRVTAVFMQECPGVRVVRDSVAQPYGPRNAGYRITTDNSFSPLSPNSGTMRVYGADGVTIYSSSGSLRAVVKGACSAIQARQGKN